MFNHYPIIFSIPKLTKELHGSLTLFSYCCIFQDIVSRKMILIFKKKNELYMFNSNDKKNIQQATSKTWASSQIWLHHRRCVHPPVNLLKSLFPHLSTKEPNKSFK